MFNSLKPGSLAGKSFYVYFCALSIVTVFIYYPSFYFFFPGGDIHAYFLETQNLNGWQLVKDCTSYTTLTKYAKGDTLLFRPLFFVFLGLERHFFGSRYAFWQLLNIILHLGIVFCLYRLLIKIKRSVFVWLLCFLFSVHFMFIHLVGWANIGAYFLYLALVLTALYHLYDYTFGSNNSTINLLWIFLCMLPACFLYETGFIFCLLFVAYLTIYNLRKDKPLNRKNFNYLIILAPVFIYLIAYFFDKFYSNNWIMDFETKKIFNLESILEVMTALPKIIFNWLGRGFFLNMTEGKFTSSLLSLQLRYALLILSTLYLGIGFCLSSEWRKKNLLFTLLIAAMTAAHMALNCFGRVGTHGMYYITHKMHPSYMFTAYLIIFIYLTVDFEGLKKRNKLIWHIGTIGLSVFILFNTLMTYRINRIMAEDQKPVRLYTDQLYRFIKNHDKEDGFSFAVVSPLPWTYITPQGYIYPKDDKLISCPYKEFSVAEVFFGEYYNKQDPKYTLQYDIKKNKLELKDKNERKQIR